MTNRDSTQAMDIDRADAGSDIRADAALDDFVVEPYDRLVRLARLICRDGSDAADAVQVALEQAWRRRPSRRDGGSLRPWLDRIVVREAIRIGAPGCPGSAASSRSGQASAGSNQPTHQTRICPPGVPSDRHTQSCRRTSEPSWPSICTRVTRSPRRPTSSALRSRRSDRGTKGVPWSNNTGGGPSYLLGDGGPAWAPDGRHLLFFDLQGSSAQLQGAAAQLTGHIADASGHVVASIPNIWVDATWSPDSTRIEAWTGGSAWIGTTQISIFGINGALQESLPLPSGYVRHHESPGFWAPDGRSVYVHLVQGAGSTSNLWQLPVDGSTPRQIAADDPLASDPSFPHDGGRLAFVGGSSPRCSCRTPTGPILVSSWSGDEAAGMRD